MIFSALWDILSRKNTSEREKCAAVILAAGSASRMNGDMNKVYLEVCGMPILAHTLLAFESCDDIDAIFIAAREEEIFYAADIAKEFSITKLKKVVRGGSLRGESVMNALCEIDEKKYGYIAIHDGARPMITREIISKTVAAAKECGAAAAGVKVKDTTKEVDERGFIKGTVDRSSLIFIQTPQVFESGLIKSAYESARDHLPDFTDDCETVERLGIKIKVVPSTYYNLKITTAEDIYFAETIFDEDLLNK